MQTFVSLELFALYSIYTYYKRKLTFLARNKTTFDLLGTVNELESFFHLVTDRSLAKITMH